MNGGKMKKLSRREFVKLTGTGLGAVYLGGCVTAFKSPSTSLSKDSTQSRDLASLRSISPINRNLADIAPRVFSGDQYSRPHRILWDKERFIDSIGGLPKASESTEVTVIGGGVSGLSSAYLLRDKKPILLEQAARMGGNAQGESWNGLDYPIGAAYFTAPEKGSPIFELFKELGMDRKITLHQEEDPVFISEKKYEKIWENGTLPENREQFRRLRQYFIDVASETHGEVFPEIPTHDPNLRKTLNQLDHLTFKAQLEKVLKAPMHPHLAEVLEHYCWSAFSASSSEISAAAGLNFYAGDFGGIAIAPGGNAGVAEALVNALSTQLGASHLRTSSLVFDVRVVSDGVLISYSDEEDKIKTLHSKTAILSCPKFVAAKLIPDLEPERLEAIQSLKYRAYLVANVLVKKGLPRFFYDVEFFEASEGGENPDPRKAANLQKVSDITYGNYPQPDPERTILTLYRPMPYDGGRPEIYSKNAYEKYRYEFEEQVNTQILPLMGLSPQDVVDLRITRWGHPLPVPELGAYASGKVDWLSKPFKDRVFFVEQDNWLLPSFETGFNEARYWTSELRKRI
jgi:hypothetical protein